MVTTQRAIDLSVVVAAPEARSNLHQCLCGLRAQLSGSVKEIIVVDGSGGEAAALFAAEFSETRFITLPRGTSVPKLWKAGIEASRGRIVAITIDGCIPGPRWVDQILRAHSTESPAIGGAIELGRNAGLVESAVYFCRYSSYMAPFSARVLNDLAGDNCSYKRAALDRVQQEWADGFWETFVHQKLRSMGKQLLFDPAIRVYYTGSVGAVDFLKTRFSHGRYFASRRAQVMARGQRILRAGVSPAVPFLMLSRIASRVWACRRRRLRFLAALPLLLSFLVAWSSGEFVGYMFGVPGGPISGREGGPVLREAG